ncbi:MAG: hypothetical protein Q8M16_10635 [Pirellulaceae bacterium]|nr:hypothetical protein [Pirellulaceae bacterium]
MFSKWFSIRTALFAMFIVAVGLYFVPTLYRRMKFAVQYNFLENNNWKRVQGISEGYEFNAPNGQMLAVYTTEREYNDETDLFEPTSFTPDPTRFFVFPPGKWVNTVDEVLESWDYYD